MKKTIAIFTTIAGLTITPFLTGMFSEAGKNLANTNKPTTVVKSNEDEDTTNTNENENEVDNTGDSTEEEYIPNIKSIKEDEFNLANEYIIYAGKFNNKEGLNKRLEEVKSKYDFAKSVDNRVVLEDSSEMYEDNNLAISAQAIYDKCREYHYGLLGVISDKLKLNEKWAAPIIRNKYIQEEIEIIEKYESELEYEKCKQSIEAVIEVINSNSDKEYNGYINYKKLIKNVIDRNQILKSKVEDIYNTL